MFQYVKRALGVRTESVRRHFTRCHQAPVGGETFEDALVAQPPVIVSSAGIDESEDASLVEGHTPGRVAKGTWIELDLPLPVAGGRSVIHAGGRKVPAWSAG